MYNHDEKKAKSDNKLVCNNCRLFAWGGGCKDFIGIYHRTCEKFKWD